jgi:oxygen-independent coproporphyrinogen-3 oxidase
MRRLEDAGYQQYEISNVAKSGREARHNLKYWQDGAWLAFGCGAHGARDGLRWRNVSGTADYVERVASGADVRAETRRLSREEAAADALFMGLRLVEGVDVAALGRRYGLDLVARHGPALEPAREAGLLRVEGTRWRLSREGMLLSTEVLSVFV